MAETDGSQIVCQNCGGQGCVFSDEDCRFYCNICYAVIDDIIDTGVGDEDFVDKGGGATYLPSHTRYTPVVKSVPSNSDHMGPREPADFGSVPKDVAIEEDDYINSIRTRYVLGVQLMIQYQCEALVEVFKVNPIVCGIAAEVWLRFVAAKRVFADDWADDVLKESENQGEKKCRIANYDKHKDEPRNIYRERVTIIWCKSLKNMIPLSSSLAISYLACHVAREAVLASDIMKWAIEGKLPYFAAFPKIEKSIKEIERSYQCPSVICPLKANYMLRPLQSGSLQKLESMAASIAKSTGLNLPPVNFYPVASRFLKQLSLPVEKILPYACRIQEWAMPPELWLSANELRLPTRVCVMSILIVAIRILYNINGFGKWEMALSAPIEDHTTGSDGYNTKGDAEAMSASSTMEVDPKEPASSVHIYESECTELLRDLEKKYDDLHNRYEYSKDLTTYLQYCKDVVFAGLEPLYKDPDLIEELWEFYQKNLEGLEASGEFEAGVHEKRPRDNDKQFGTSNGNKNHDADEPAISLSANSSGSRFRNGSPDCRQTSGSTFRDSQAHETSETTEKAASSQTLKDTAIRHLKIDMEEHRFCYIPPRVRVKRNGYLRYQRKGGDGAYTYVAHADYYILLRACAKVAQIDARVMHYSVLSLEKRLGSIEKSIDECVKSCKTSSEANITSKQNS